MLEKALQEANAQLEREFFSEVIRVAIVFQQRGDDIAQSQMRQLQYSVTQGNHLRHESIIWLEVLILDTTNQRSLFWNTTGEV